MLLHINFNNNFLSRTKQSFQQANLTFHPVPGLPDRDRNQRQRPNPAWGPLCCRQHWRRVHLLLHPRSTELRILSKNDSILKKKTIPESDLTYLQKLFFSIYICSFPDPTISLPQFFNHRILNLLVLIWIPWSKFWNDTCTTQIHVLQTESKSYLF